MKFTIDYLKWRCGGSDRPENNNALGKGDTALLNIQGFMCCLGQCALQRGFSRETIFNLNSPTDLGKEDIIFNYKLNIGGGFLNTPLSVNAISINDDTESTPKEKIEKLIPLFAANGHELEFINVPT